MTEKEQEIFVRPNPEAHKRFKKSKRKKKLLTLKKKVISIGHVISQIILWICAVGGFILSLIQFFQDKQ